MSLKCIANSLFKNPGNRGKFFFKTLTAIAWQIQKRTIRKTFILRLANGVKFRAYPDCVISSALIYAEWPEYQEIQFLRRFLSPDEILIDVGANVGHFSLLLSDIPGSDKVYAFEPTPVSFRRLQENWTLNGWSHANLFQMAIGSCHGKGYIPDTPKPVTTNRIATNPLPGYIEIPIVTLDEMRWLWEGKKIGLLKIDVEGYELHVISGARELLRTNPPRFLLFESLSGKLEQPIAECLQSCNYCVFQLNDKGIPDFQHLSAQNLFAVQSNDPLLQICGKY